MTIVCYQLLRFRRALPLHCVLCAVRVAFEVRGSCSVVLLKSSVAVVYNAGEV